MGYYFLLQQTIRSISSFPDLASLSGNPLQCFCLENPRDRGSLVSSCLWSRTESDTTEQLSSSSSSNSSKLTFNESKRKHVHVCPCACVQMYVPACAHLLEKSKVYSMGPGVGKRRSGLDHREPEKKLLISELHLVIGEN